MSQMRYSAAVARVILREIREGNTLKRICRKKGMPPRLLVYDWLRDPRKKVGDRTFERAYNDALKDRSISWQDEALESLEAFTNGKNQDLAQMNAHEKLGRFKLSLSKETIAAAKESGSGGPEAPTVVIKRFVTDESESRGRRPQGNDQNDGKGSSV